MQKHLMILFAVVVLAVGLATPAYAAPPGRCDPWPACKDDPDGDGPGESTCNEVYEVDTCILLGTGTTTRPEEPCDLVRFTDQTPGWRFTDNCQTSQPLSIKDADHILDGAGHQLTLVGPWEGGPAAITNDNGRAVVRNLTIYVSDSDVAPGTCDGLGSHVEAAISFDPHILSFLGVPGTRVEEVTIDTDGGAQFCNAIEIKGDVSAGQIHGVGVSGSMIEEDSYSQSGIHVDGINIVDDSVSKFNVVNIFNNRVYPSVKSCVAIQVGPLIERANIEDNDVDVPGCVNSDGVGIGISIENSAANIVGNSLNTEDGDDFDVGISIVDSAIGTNEGNAITGDSGDDPYCVVDSVVPFPTKGKNKNTFTFNGDTIGPIISSTCP